MQAEVSESLHTSNILISRNISYFYHQFWKQMFCSKVLRKVWCIF